MNITNTIAQLPVRAQKLVLKSLVASLNQSIIGYARSHIRSIKYAPKADMHPAEKLALEIAEDTGTKTFDELNESQIANDLNGSAKEFMLNAGNEVVETPLELCLKFTALRNWMEQMIQETQDYNPQYDAPFSVANSLAFQIQRAPTSNADEMKKKSIATGIPLHRLLSVEAKAADDERAQMILMAPAVLALYDDCTSAQHDMKELPPNLDGEISRVLDDVVNVNVENMISCLPIPSQYKMGIKVNDVLIKASDDAVKLMLRPRQRGSDTAAGDVAIIDAARLEHFNLLKIFDKQHSAALDAYAERSFLPIIPDNFEEPVAEAMKVQSAKEAEVIPLTPAAVKPVAVKAQPVAERRDALAEAITKFQTSMNARRTAV